VSDEQQENDAINRLVSDFWKRFAHLPKHRKPPKYQSSALALIDAILSINQRYNAFVLPKVEAFGTKHPTVNTLSELKALIGKCGGPVRFFEYELKYSYPDRAETFHDVLGYLRGIVEKYQGTSEFERLYNWAVSVSPSDFKNVGIYGFGLATFQYLRMLLGADTCKPDRWILRYVKKVLGRSVSAWKALQLMEEAARITGISLREIDREIWRRCAGNKSKGCA
jgi:hypothetical protein